MAGRKGILKAFLLVVIGFVVGAAVAGSLVAWRYFQMLKWQHYSCIHSNANIVHLARAGCRQELIRSIESSLRQYVLSADAMYGDDEERLAAFWHLQWYYEKFDLPVPQDIKPILDRLPPRPPRVCRLLDLEQPKPPIALNGPLEFRMSQRSTTPLPGSSERILLTIDDITRGQVMMSLSWQDGNIIVATRSMGEKDTVTFTVDSHTYKIELKQLTNVLVGEDVACFELSLATTESGQMLSENDKIEKLISSLRDVDGAKFIRNGEEHTVDEAITHLRRKWQWRKTEIKTAHDFITIAGSISSTTGKPYVIRYSDGSEITSEKWFRKQLQTIDKLQTSN